MHYLSALTAPLPFKTNGKYYQVKRKWIKEVCIFPYEVFEIECLYGNVRQNSYQVTGESTLTEHTIHGFYRQYSVI